LPRLARLVRHQAAAEVASRPLTSARSTPRSSTRQRLPPPRPGRRMPPSLLPLTGRVTTP